MDSSVTQSLLWIKIWLTASHPVRLVIIFPKINPLVFADFFAWDKDVINVEKLLKADHLGQSESYCSFFIRRKMRRNCSRNDTCFWENGVNIIRWIRASTHKKFLISRIRWFAVMQQKSKVPEKLRCRLIDQNTLQAGLKIGFLKFSETLSLHFAVETEMFWRFCNDLCRRTSLGNSHSIVLG